LRLLPYLLPFCPSLCPSGTIFNPSILLFCSSLTYPPFFRPSIVTCVLHLSSSLPLCSNFLPFFLTTLPPYGLLSVLPFSLLSYLFFSRLHYIRTFPDTL
jgi:hypothetical protein